MIKTNEIAYCAILGAVALLLPLVFHLFHLGHIFMPMYLPLVLLGFYVGPAAAGITSFIIPLISALATGMPPFYPPVAAVMS
ncbi:MAG: ECF transporter S component, partial [Candidatus Aureabacteria bacterium]|nr:ECF transporter S component [Candidatus Auribacterota bacterium]